MKNKQHNQSHLSNQIFITRGGAYKKRNGLKAKKASKNPKTFTPKSFEEVVPQLSWESQRRYEILRLYCHEDSLMKLDKKLDSLLRSDSCLKMILSNKGKLPSRRSLDRWCKKFHWVRRKEKWVAEKCRQTAYWFTKNKLKTPSFLEAVKIHQGYTKDTPINDGGNSPTVLQDYSRNEDDITTEIDGKSYTKVDQKLVRNVAVKSGQMSANEGNLKGWSKNSGNFRSDLDRIRQRMTVICDQKRPKATKNGGYKDHGKA